MLSEKGLKFSLQEPVWEVGAVPDNSMWWGVWKRILEAEPTLLAPHMGQSRPLRLCSWSSSSSQVTIAPWECSAGAELTYSISRHHWEMQQEDSDASSAFGEEAARQVLKLSLKTCLSLRPVKKLLPSGSWLQIRKRRCALWEALALP